MGFTRLTCTKVARIHTGANPILAELITGSIVEVIEGQPSPKSIANQLIGYTVTVGWREDQVG
jgi:hypothetical protein